MHSPTFLIPKLVGGDLVLVSVFCHGQYVGVTEDALAVDVAGVLSACCNMVVWARLLENIPEVCLDLRDKA